MVKPIPAIIPARGGSKGIPKKNIKDFAGKPLIAWTIEAAQKSKSISNVIVSTDDENIADISTQYGAWIPFMRPKELAADESLAIDTYVYTVNRLNNEFFQEIENFFVLQPTSPLRNNMHIDESYNIFLEKKPDSLISVTDCGFPISWIKKISPSGHLESIFSQSDILLNRQSEKNIYKPNGAIYIHNYDLLSESRTYYFNNTIPYIMDKYSSVDIDEEIDFVFAEFLINSVFINKQ